MDDAIINEIKEFIEPDSVVHAMWIGGSLAEGYNDELSDIDLWLEIDDGHDQVIFDAIENFLRTKGTIDVNFSEGVTPPFSHKVYHLAGTDPLHFIEVNLHSHSHKFGLFDRLRKIKIIFDKDHTTDFEPIDTASYDKMLSDRKEFLIEKVKLGVRSVEKEIKRQQFLDAMHNYFFWLVEPIIELARIKYSPLKIAYSLKHASRDLPADTVKEIESLYKVASLDDLNNKISQIKIMLTKYS